MIACLDLEGVLIPEIWLNVAYKTKIKELEVTTREISDYDQLMQYRLKILKEHKITLQDIQEVIATLKPLEGAQDFLKWLKTEFQVIILSDTYYEFMQPLMSQLDYPCLFCHRLETNSAGEIVGYHLRLHDQKTKAVNALKGLNFKIAATGDSYNDTGMLLAADFGVLFCPPEKVIQDFPALPVAKSYEELKTAFLGAKKRLGA